MKKTGKKVISFLMALCMALALTPQLTPKAAAVTTARTTALDLTASSIAYAGGAGTGNPTSGNITDTSEGWAWYYTSADGNADKTLVLDGLNLVTSDAYALTLPADTTIVLADGSENTVASTYSNNGFTVGIHGFGSLTIQGRGTLDVTGGNPTNENGSIGILLEYEENGLLTIEDGATVSASGGDTQSASCGVKGNVRVNSGTLSATGGTGMSGSYGIYSSSSNFAGGTTTAKSASAGVAMWNAVYATDSISDTGMTVKQNDGSDSYTIAASQSSDGTYYVYNDTTPATDVLISSGPVASAAVEDATVSGSMGTALPGSDTVTVTLTGCTFTGLAADAAAGAWFANLPEGLAVTVQSVASDNQSAVLAFSGTPTAASGAAMEITIPGGKLNTGSALAVTANSNAKFAIIGITPPTPSFAESGDGSADHPYEIGTAEQLKELSEFVNTQNDTYGSACYQLTDDIVLNADLSDSSEQWSPIGVDEESIFIGVFDGNGYTISGLYINDTEGELHFAGLFGAVWGATIKNLGLIDGSITTGESAVGGIAAFGIQAHIENCYNSCTISAVGDHAAAGGIIGVNSESGLTVVNCYNTGSVTVAVSEDGEEACAGGIVGRNIDSSIRNCYSAGLITATASGGAVAYMGGIAGKNDLDDGVIENAFWLSGTAVNGLGYDETKATSSDAGCPSISNIEMRSAGFVNTLNGNVTALEDDYPNLSAWRAAGATENGGYPVFATLVATYTLTITGGGTGASVGGDYEAGASVPVSAGTRSGYTFSGWTTSGGGTFAIAGSANTTFTMPGAAVTITANWTEDSTQDDGPDSHDGSGSPGGNNPGAEVLVNGRPQAAGTLKTSTGLDGRTTTTVTVDSNRLGTILASENIGATVTIPVAGGPGTASGVLTGEMVKNMEDKAAKLVVQTDSGSYTLPASEINIDAVSQQFGENVSLSDITVTVSISEPPAETLQVVENAAEDGGFAIVVSAVEYTITCEYGGRTVNVSRFNAYVERTVAIPDGVDPARITTAVVVDPDGTVHHVPTRITVIGGKYYAVINSLTNSTYSVVWNPVAFSDVTNHWAKDSVNNMGSRMVVSSTGDNRYEPDRNMTRAEFAAIIVKALGLEPESGETGFHDVFASEWYCGYIETAASYGIIHGYENENFGPNDTITREQAMIMLARAMKLTGLESGLTDHEIGSLTASYTDEASVSDYAKQSVASCLDEGIVNGRGNSTIAPKDHVTRAEVAVMVERLLKNSGLI